MGSNIRQPMDKPLKVTPKIKTRSTKSNKVNTSLFLDKELLEKFKVYCQLKGDSFNARIIELIKKDCKKFTDEQYEQYKKLREEL